MRWIIGGSKWEAYLDGGTCHRYGAWRGEWVVKISQGAIED